MNDRAGNEPRSLPAPELLPANALVDSARHTALGRGTSSYRPAFDVGDRDTDLRATLAGYLRVIRKRRWLILSIATAVLGIGLGRTLMETPLYAASVRIQIDRQAAKIVDGGGVPGAEVADAESLRTQFELLRSRALAERVASALKAGDDLEMLKPRSFSLATAIRSLLVAPQQVDPAATDAQEREARAVGIIAGNAAIRPVAGSRLVDIAYADPSPTRAARIANAYAEAYIGQTIDKRFQANAYARTFLDDQSQQLLIRLQESERALLRFAEDKQIIILSEKSTIAESNLAAANAVLSNLIAERIRNEQIWSQVSDHKGLSLPQFLTNAVIQQLRAARKGYETEYQDKLQTFKPSYPAMVELSARMREIDRQLEAEVQTIRASLMGAYQSSLQQEQKTKAQIEQLRAEVLDLQKHLIQYNILKREVDTNRSLYNGLLQRLKEVEVAGGVGTNNVFIVDRAQVPASPASPNVANAILLWLAFGLGAGFGAAYLLEILDDTVRALDELEQITGLATLGVIPKIGAGTTVEREIGDPRSALSEAYRSFCTSLQFATDRGLPRSILITSAGASEGKSISSLAIGRHFATMGLTVLLVDADLRNPSLHAKLGQSNGIGLSNYLIGACRPPEAIRATDLPGLAFMPTGPLPPNAADLLASPRLHALLSAGLDVFDLIVVDGPPVMGLADAQLLSSAVSATVLVVGAGQARAGSVRAALKRMELARAPLIGTLLTRFDAGSVGYGYGDDYTYASYGHDAGLHDRHGALTSDAPGRERWARLPTDGPGA